MMENFSLCRVQCAALAAAISLLHAGTAWAADAPPITINARVVNTTTNPVPVTVISAPTPAVVQPFTRRFGFLDNTPLTDPNRSFTVPADKILLIETVSVNANTLAGAIPEMFFTVFLSGQVSTLWRTPVVRFGQTAGRDYFDGGSHNVRIYAQPGTTVTFTGQALLPGGNVSSDFSISGQLLSAP